MSFENANTLKLRKPTDAPMPKPVSGARVSDALLEPSEIQDLADRLPDLLSASAGLGLKFRVGVELSEDAPAEARDELNKVLGEVSDRLRTS